MAKKVGTSGMNGTSLLDGRDGKLMQVGQGAIVAIGCTLSRKVACYGKNNITMCYIKWDKACQKERMAMHCLFCVPMRHFIVVTMCLNFGHFLSCIKFVTCAFNNSHMNIVNYFSPFVCQLHLLCYLFNYKVHTLKEKLKFTTYKSD